MLFDQQGQYRGNLSSNPYDPNSTSNPYGRYGSQFSPDSINNPYGAGSRYAPDSPTNPFGSGWTIMGALKTQVGSLSSVLWRTHAHRPRPSPRWDPLDGAPSKAFSTFSVELVTG